MIDELLVHDVAGLTRLAEASEAKSLAGLTDLAMRSVPRCCAATLTVWRGPIPDDPTGTHPSVVRLVETQLAVREGPLLDAVDTRQAVYCADTLAEKRWPVYRRHALRAGVRSSFTGVEPVAEWLVTMTVWAVRPGAFQADESVLTTLLANHATALVANLALYQDAQRTAKQLNQAADSRALIDQAKGVLMQLRGCDPETAFAQLREESQRTHTRVVDVARNVIEAAQTSASRRSRPQR
jgi:ANTAR domain